MSAKNDEALSQEIFRANIHDDDKTFQEHAEEISSCYWYFSKFSEEPEKKHKPIEYILVIGFDHKIGSIIEYIYPEPVHGDVNEEVQWSLTFLGLPDGAHSVTSDYSFFITPDGKGGLYYCVSCYR